VISSEAFLGNFTETRGKKNKSKRGKDILLLPAQEYIKGNFVVEEDTEKGEKTHLSITL
jgi:hypothetical protein